MPERNIKLIVSYIGTRFSGWQVQPDVRTLHRTLQDAVEKIVNHPISMISSSRTDAGVHAEGHVVNFKTTTHIKTPSIAKAINAVVDKDIIIRSSKVVPTDFHARYAPKWKEYRYTIHTSELPDLYYRPFCWHVTAPLNITLMRNAAKLLVGKKDFMAFGSKRVAKGGSSVRHVMACTIQRKGDKIIIRIRAKGFLYKMARFMVGTLVLVGRGSMTIGEVKALLKIKRWAAAGPVAPAQGLCLMKVRY